MTLFLLQSPDCQADVTAHRREAANQGKAIDLLHGAELCQAHLIQLDRFSGGGFGHRPQGSVQAEGRPATGRAARTARKMA